MSLIARYADKHSKKLQFVNRASSNEDKSIKNKETYVTYLEGQVEKGQSLIEQKIFQLERIVMEHDEKFENVIRLIRLLQAFAETQDQENTNIKSLIQQQYSQLQDQELLNLKTIVQNNDRAVNQCSQCIGELQGAYQDIEKTQQDFEQRVEEFVQKVSHDLTSDFKQLQTSISPRVDLSSIEQQLNKKIEVIMNELRQTALRKDLSQIEFRLKNIEQQMPQIAMTKTNIDQKSQPHFSSQDTDDQTYRLKREIEDIRMVLSQCLSEQQNLKQYIKVPPSQMEVDTFATKQDLINVDQKFTKKLTTAIDKLGNLIQISQEQDHDKSVQPLKIKKVIPYYLEDKKPPLPKEIQQARSISQDKNDTNMSLDHLPQKLQTIKRRKRRSSSQGKKDKSEKSISQPQKFDFIFNSRTEKHLSLSRGQSPMAQSTTLNKFQASRQSKEEKVKELIKKRRQLSPKYIIDPEKYQQVEKNSKIKKQKKKS